MQNFHLDPTGKIISRAQLTDIVRRLKEQGTTIVTSNCLPKVNIFHANLWFCMYNLNCYLNILPSFTLVKYLVVVFLIVVGVVEAMFEAGFELAVGFEPVE